MNRLELVKARRGGGGGKTAREFADFLVDGRSLYAILDARGFDVISAVGWGPDDWQRVAVERFLRRQPPDLPDDRTAIYICPECGDLDCGAVIQCSGVLRHSSGASRGTLTFWRAT